MPGPQPEDVAFAVQADTDRGVDGPVGDLPVADLDHDRVDEDRGVDLIEWPHRPVLHLLEHLVGDPADRLLAHRGAVDLSEVRSDLPGGQALGIQRQHDLIDPAQPPLPLLDDLRLEACRPGPAAPRCPPARWPRSAPSWRGCRYGCCPSQHRPGRASHSRDARSVSSFSAVSITVLVSCLSSPSGQSTTRPAPGPAAPAPPPPAAPATAPASSSLPCRCSVAVITATFPANPQGRRVRPETPLDPQS